VRAISRSPESTVIQLRGTIQDIVKTQHYENKSCLVTKRTKTTLNVKQSREKMLNSIDTRPTSYNRV